jgi:succinyl-diaminopimelate desuccinylase
MQSFLFFKKPEASQAMHSKLFQAVATGRDAMVALTQELVAIPTENPPGSDYGPMMELLCRRLNDLGFQDTQVIDNCILSFLGEGERTIYFSGHYDVVPAQSHRQFEPMLKGPNLFGRGSSDMKSGLAAMIFAAKALLDCEVPLKGRVGLVFVPDEETAGPGGSRHLAEVGVLGRNGIAMLTPEPTSGVIWNANRGAITLKVTIKGKSAHVGRQRDGLNAFENMLKVTDGLRTLKEEVERRATAFQIAPESARRSILMLGGRAEAGTNFNVVPDFCSFTIDRRINPEEDFETERRRLFEALAGSGVDMEIETLQEGKSSGVAEGCAEALVLARAVHAVTGRPAQFELCPGLLEIRFYAERGIPAFAYGPGLLSVSHGPNEFVPIDRMVECAQVYALAAHELLA